MGSVAQQFWDEVLDLRRPVQAESRTTRRQVKLARVRVRRSGGRPLPHRQGKTSA